MTTIEDIERSEFKAVDALSRLSARHPGRPRLEAALARLRVAKATLLSASPDLLRKSASSASGAQRRWRDGFCDTQESSAMAKAARDRASEEHRIGHYQEAERRRLGLHAGRRRYKAPDAFKGRSVALPGRKIDVPEHGIIEVDEGSHPAARGASESPDHQMLLALGFRQLPDNPDEVDDAAMKAISAIHRGGAIRGEAAVMRFLSHDPRAR
jgi:hypothetical protein